MDFSPIEGDVRIHVPYTYKDETGTTRNGWLPVYIRADCPSAQCSRTGMHRAVFPNLAEVCYHHPDLREHMNHSTFIVPGRPAQSRAGEMQMEAATPKTSGMREASSVTSSPIGLFHDPNITRVEERPASEGTSPASSLNSERTSTMMQTMAQGYVPDAFPRTPSPDDDGDGDSPPLDLHLSPGYHTPIPRPQSPAHGYVDVGNPQTRSSEQSTPPEGIQLESRAPDRPIRRDDRQSVKEALRDDALLDSPEVEDPVPTRYQQPEFNMDTSGLVFCNEQAEVIPVPERAIAARALRRAVRSLPSSSKASPLPNEMTKPALTKPSSNPSASPRYQQISKPTIPAPDTISSTSTLTSSLTSPPPPYSSSLSGSWEMVDVPRPTARLTVATTSSLSSPTSGGEDFTTCSCELLGGDDWHATWCERWEVVEGGA